MNISPIQSNPLGYQRGGQYSCNLQEVVDCVLQVEVEVATSLIRPEEEEGEIHLLQKNIMVMICSLRYKVYSMKAGTYWLDIHSSKAIV